ncbi:hypothetical protein NHX12_019622 [Muraenolepis orangiensis]|uniref:Uncharacterized protein n=1 Tax=Muraenolepis orangiensis TaxID=630683 RepID=A0A9Q0ETU2_9TELE|nr:hypothetical protein NHX12_019622 [Muraenolepis orangiensis]
MLDPYCHAPTIGLMLSEIGFQSFALQEAMEKFRREAQPPGQSIEGTERKSTENKLHLPCGWKAFSGLGDTLNDHDGTIGYLGVPLPEPRSSGLLFELHDNPSCGGHSHQVSQRVPMGGWRYQLWP